MNSTRGLKRNHNQLIQVVRFFVWGEINMVVGHCKIGSFQEITQPHVIVFSMSFYFYFLYYFIFIYLLLELCGQLNKANKILLLALLKILNAISSSLLKDLLSWVLMESLQRHGF